MELKIGAVSKMTGISPSGIRFLEEQGLISPSGGRKGKYRSYSLADVSALLDYRNYRKCGLTQEEILALIRTGGVEEGESVLEAHCDELEDRILETTRLLHFLRRRRADAALITRAESFCEIAERPAIIWMSLENEEGNLSDWPEIPGFEIPYTDSILLHSPNPFLTGEGPSPACLGIGLLESDTLHAGFLDRKDIRYFPHRTALHLIVEISRDFRLSDTSMNRVRSLLAAEPARCGYCPVQDHPVLTKRILSVGSGDAVRRYDHLWIDLEKTKISDK